MKNSQTGTPKSAATLKPKGKDSANKKVNAKSQQLEEFTRVNEEAALTTNQGVGIADNQNSLKAGLRGPTLMEDFILREKITHFDHERIPERIVHARGAGAFGYFQVYEPLTELSKADFLQNSALQTPVFVRFSTVAGSRGSADLARDVRGFAVKFYTRHGNFDLVGNNIPVFFIQDAIKFPDLIHAVKPEPHNEIPQAASAHDTFWDFVSLMPESMHMIMWVMSDRAIPRSFRMMEGFGIHTFRLVSADGHSRFVKFHWKPKLGVHSLVWDEALKVNGFDPDFHRRDLWNAIESGAFPEWELGLQIVEEKDADKFEFDLLDPTKIIPEELVPVRRVGKLVLNRNPDNFFAETEQVAFCPANIVPGIDFSEDPLLQGRLFSYQDTQLIRLGGPNFTEIPINRPVCPVHNLQRDGYMRQTIDRGRVAYEPNSLGGGCPVQNADLAAAFSSVARRLDGKLLRERSPSFADHFTQATLFYASQSPVEQQHIVDALSFELSKVDVPHVRERVVSLLANIDSGLAEKVGANLGIEPSADISYLNETTATKPNNKRGAAKPGKSAALSMANTVKDTIESRLIAVLAADGCDAKAINAMKAALTAGGAKAEIVAPHLGAIKGAESEAIVVDKTLSNCASVLFDAVFVAGGDAAAATLSADAHAIHFVKEAFKHGKAIAALGAGIDLLQVCKFPALSLASDVKGKTPTESVGVVTLAGTNVKALLPAFIAAIAQHRHWERDSRFLVDA